MLEAYGAPDVLEIRDLPKPEPKPGEVRIRVVATTAHVGDARIRRADPFVARVKFGLVRPRRDLVLGLELSGVVDAVGPGAGTFAPGDEVMAFCGFDLGGNAEYRCLKVAAGNAEKYGAVVSKPESLSFEEAAALPTGAMTALRNLRKAGLRAGQSILINGASGSLGTYAVQLAKDLGAHVTAVCSARNRELVEALGADEVIDYRHEDFTRLGSRFDVVYDAVGLSTPRECRRLLRPGGVHVRNRGVGALTLDDLEHVAGLAANGVLRPVVDRVVPLERVAEAHGYVDTGRKRGSVVLAL